MSGPLLLDPSDVGVDFKRDRWGRPYIMQADGKRKGYTRCSSAAKLLEDEYNLNQWDRRGVTYGMAYDASLVARMLAIGGDPGVWDQETKKAVNAIVDDARAVAKAHKAADIGTAIHKLTERMDRGEQVVGGPYQADLDAYREAINQSGMYVTPEWVECRMVNDELEMAGTCDRILAGEGSEVWIADVKTSASVDFGGLGWAAQLAAYAGGKLYDVEKEERMVTPPIDLRFGYIIHLPAGQGRCTIYEVDLVGGLAAARLANEIRAIRKQSKTWITPWSASDPIAPTTPEPVPWFGITADEAVAKSRDIWRVELMERFEALTHDQKGEFKGRRIPKGDLDAVEKALDDIVNPPTMRETQAKVAELKTPQTAINPKPDEGPDVDGARWEQLGDLYKKLPQPASDWCARILGQAKNGGVPFHRTNHPTLRRYELYRGLIRLAGWVWDGASGDTYADQTVIGLTSAVHNKPVDDYTPGHALGQLDHIEAAAFSQLVDELVNEPTQAESTSTT